MAPAVSSIRYRFGHFELRPAERQLLAAATLLRIGPHAFDLLVVLVERSGQLVTKDELLRRVWPKVVIEDNTLQAHVSAVRKALGSDAIATVSGRGYRFALPVVIVQPAATVEPPHNLSHDLTSFIGREHELAELEQSLSRTRLITLVGAGGCGKTRLATRFARQVLSRYAGGTWLVELAALSDGDLVAATVANVLTLKERPGQAATERISEFIGESRVLLLLDNAEHLLDAAAQLAEALLRRCGQLVIVVTSRERLGITGELVYRVPSLSVPDVRESHALAEIMACESARLFIDRARLQEPNFRVAETESRDLASICRRLDGIALAIELAVPRVRSMSLGELSGRLDQRFELLVEGSRTALPRHRTLRSLIDWGFEPLSDAEKALLCASSVFSGGWSAEAAHAVCRDGDGELDDTVLLLSSLVDKNLVVAGTGSVRYRLLETVREYARDRLRESGDEMRVQRAHLAHFLAFAQRENEEINGVDARGALDRLELDHDNLRAALSFASTPRGDTATAMLLVAKLWRFWQARGYLSESRHWFDDLLSLPSDVSMLDARGKCLNSAVHVELAIGNLASARRLAEESVNVQRRLDIPRSIAISLSVLGNVLSSLGEYAQACKCMEEGLAIRRSLGTRLDGALNNLGLVLQRVGDLEQARVLHEEALSIQREHGDHIGVGGSLMNLADIALNAGDPAAAREFYEQAAKPFEELDDQWHLGRIWTALGFVMCDEGNFDGALKLLRKGLVTSVKIDDRPNVCDTLQALGNALATHDPEAAAKLWGAGERQREFHAGMVLTAQEQERDGAVHAHARALLGDDTSFDRAWADGRALQFEEAVDYAMRF